MALSSSLKLKGTSVVSSVILILSLSVPVPSLTEAVLIKDFNITGGLMEGCSGSLLSEGHGGGGGPSVGLTETLLTLSLVGA